VGRGDPSDCVPCGVLDEHGPGAVAPYIGDPPAFDALGGPAIGALCAQLGVRRSLRSGTQDCANKCAGREAVSGSTTMRPLPNFAHTDFFLSFGSNPRLSRASFFSIADPLSNQVFMTAVPVEVTALRGRWARRSPGLGVA